MNGKFQNPHIDIFRQIYFIPQTNSSRCITNKSKQNMYPENVLKDNILKDSFKCLFSEGTSLQMMIFMTKCKWVKRVILAN